MLTDTAARGEDALSMAAATPFDVVVLDVNLPGIDGFETVRRLRADGIRTPVLMLTARDGIDGSHLRYDSPLDYVWTMKRELREYPLHVFLYVGDGDSDRDQIYPMDRALRDVGANVHYAIYPGGHSWGLWSPRTEQMLLMASHDFAGRCPALA